jgi:hypothetical protein
MKATIAVPVAYATLWLTLGVSGLLGGGRLLSIIIIPVGGAMALGAGYVALNIHHIAEDLGEDTRRRMRSGSWWDRLAVTWEPDQVRRFRATAMFHVVFGLVLCLLGIYVNGTSH